MHTEVDLEYVFGVAVTVTKATSVVTWEQSVKHVVKKATWQESVDPHVPKTNKAYWNPHPLGRHAYNRNHFQMTQF